MMIEELSKLLCDMLGKENCNQGFLHIVNLIAKQLLKQLDVPCKEVDSVLNEAEKKLFNLATGIDIEELVNAAERGARARSEDNDDMDGWVDEMEELNAEECAMLEESVQPVQLVLVKVR